MDVPNPRRILILSPPDSNVPSLLKGSLFPSPLPKTPLFPPPQPRQTTTETHIYPQADLTGSAPSPNPNSSSPPSSLAGLSHTLALKTTYYSATIPIWIDEINSAPEWRDEFLRPEAKEVLSVLGAVVLCFRKPVDAGEKVRSLALSVEQPMCVADGVYI
jgi:hypothetical protein